MNQEQLRTYLHGVIDTIVDGMQCPDDEEWELFDAADEVIEEAIENYCFMVPKGTS